MVHAIVLHSEPSWPSWPADTCQLTKLTSTAGPPTFWTSGVQGGTGAVQWKWSLLLQQSLYSVLYKWLNFNSLIRPTVSDWLRLCWYSVDVARHKVRVPCRTTRTGSILSAHVVLTSREYCEVSWFNDVTACHDVTSWNSILRSWLVKRQKNMQLTSEIDLELYKPWRKIKPRSTMESLMDSKKTKEVLLESAKDTVCYM